MRKHQRNDAVSGAEISNAEAVLFQKLFAYSTGGVIRKDHSVYAVTEIIGILNEPKTAEADLIDTFTHDITLSVSL